MNNISLNIINKPMVKKSIHRLMMLIGGYRTSVVICNISSLTFTTRTKDDLVNTLNASELSDESLNQELLENAITEYRYLLKNRRTTSMLKEPAFIKEMVDLGYKESLSRHHGLKSNKMICLIDMNEDTHTLSDRK